MIISYEIYKQAFGEYEMISSDTIRFCSISYDLLNAILLPSKFVYFMNFVGAAVV